MLVQSSFDVKVYQGAKQDLYAHVAGAVLGYGYLKEGDDGGLLGLSLVFSMKPGQGDLAELILPPDQLSKDVV